MTENYEEERIQKSIKYMEEKRKELDVLLVKKEALLKLKEVYKDTKKDLKKLNQKVNPNMFQKLINWVNKIG